jgi:internalin A
MEDPQSPLQINKPATRRQHKRPQYGVDMFHLLVCVAAYGWVSPAQSSNEAAVDFHRTEVLGRQVLATKVNNTVIGLSLKNLKLTNAEIQKVAMEFPGLRELDLSGNALLTDDCLESISEMRRIEVLHLDRCGIAGTGLRFLRHIPTLSYLSLKYTKVSDAGVAELASIQSLRKINLCGTRIRLSAFESWSDGAIARIELLGIGEASDGDMAGLKRLKNLKCLDLTLTRVTDNGLAWISNANLEELILTDTKVSDEGCKSIRRSPSLRVIRIDGTDVGDAGIRQLSELRALASLDISGEKITDKGLTYISKCSELQSLSCINARVTDDGLKSLKPLSLTSLDLSHCEGITLKGVNDIGKMSGLERLDLWRTGVSDEGLLALKGLLKLSALSIGSSQVTDEGLLALSHLPKLSRLNLAATHVSDRGLLALTPMKSLRWISVTSNPRISDEGVERFESIRPDILIVR